MASEGGQEVPEMSPKEWKKILHEHEENGRSIVLQEPTS